MSVQVDVFRWMCSGGCIQVDVFRWMCSGGCVQVGKLAMPAGYG